jgi:YHS domain-containing protein
VIRRLLILLVAVFVWWWARKLIAPRNTEAARPGGLHEAPQKVSGIMVRDPVCGTFLPRDGAINVERDRELTYFCSERCQKKFIESGDSGKPAAVDPEN